MRRWISVLLLYLTVLVGTTQAGKVELVAGSGAGGDNVLASEAKLNTPFGVDFDSSGNLYFVELQGHRVCKVDPKGKLTVVAGTGKKGDKGDNGPGLQAEFNGMHNLAIAPTGEVYLADTWNYKVRKYDPKSGQVTTLAGTGEKGFTGDGGQAKSAKLGGIYCVTLDPKGEKLYLADLDNKRIRVIELKSGVIDSIAGTGKAGVPKDGDDAKTSPLVDPRAVTADAKGNVYILERGGHALRVVDPSGKIRTVVGASGKPGHTGDNGEAKAATLRGPKHLCIDLEGNVLIADTDNHVIRKYLVQEGKIVHVVGLGKVSTAGIGAEPSQLGLNQPHGVYVHPKGTLYIADSHNHRIVKFDR